MIVYNVTVNVTDQIHDRWLEWMLNDHIPKVLETSMFRSYRIFKILSRQPEETGSTYSIQYYAEQLSDYEYYRDEFAPKLQQDAAEKFGGQFTAFRTLLEEI